MSHWDALSVSFILVLHILQGKVILEVAQIQLVSMLIRDLLMKIVTVVSVSCWGVLLEFMCFHVNQIAEDIIKKLIQCDI